MVKHFKWKEYVGAVNQTKVSSYHVLGFSDKGFVEYHEKEGVKSPCDCKKYTEEEYKSLSN